MTRIRKGSKSFDSLPPPLSNEQLLRAIDSFSEKAHASLSADDLAASWSSPKMDMVNDVFIAARNDISRGAPVKFIPIARGLDDMGIGQSPLASEACRIANEINRRAK